MLEQVGVKAPFDRKSRVKNGTKRYMSEVLVEVNGDVCLHYINEQV